MANIKYVNEKKVKKGINLAAGVTAALLGFSLYINFNSNNTNSVLDKKSEIPKSYDCPKKVDYYIGKVYDEHSIVEEVTPKFVNAIISIESQYHTKAVSRTGARGMMQIMKPTWNIIKPNFPFEEYAFDPEMNIEVGIRHLSGIEKYCETKHPHWGKLSEKVKLECISAGYNGGTKRLKDRKWNVKAMPLETRNYVKKMNKIMQKYVFD